MRSSKDEQENVLGSESVRVEQTTQTYYKLVVSIATGMDFQNHVWNRL